MLVSVACGSIVQSDTLPNDGPWPGGMWWGTSSPTVMSGGRTTTARSWNEVISIMSSSSPLIGNRYVPFSGGITKSRWTILQALGAVFTGCEMKHTRTVCTVAFSGSSSRVN